MATSAQRRGWSRSPRAGRWALVGLAGAAAAAVAAAVADERAGRAALSALDPVVRPAARLGGLLLADPRPAVTWTALVAAAAMAVIAAWPRVTASGRWLAAAAAAAVVGQLALLWRSPLAGAAGYVAAVAMVLLARRGTGRPGFAPLAEEPERIVRGAEGAALLAIGVVAVVLRLYALDRVVWVFEGELSPYMVGAASWPGTLLANAGAGGPWAPLGFLYYLPIRLGIELAGHTVLAVRLGSALVALLTVAVGWLLAREAAGRWAGVAAAALLALDPLQIGWGRSDVHPHGATAWPGMLLCWVTIRLLRAPTFGRFAAAAALMGLCWYQYPSGQVAVAVPVVAVTARWAWDRDFRRRAGWRVALVAVGAAAWLGGPYLTSWLGGVEPTGIGRYVEQLGPRVAGGDPEAPLTPADRVAHAAGNAADLAAGVTLEVPHLFHQTFLPLVEGLPRRSLPWPTAVLAVLGLAALASTPRLAPSVPLLTLVAAGASSAVFARVAYVKRAAAMYPALAVVAAVAAALLVAALAGAVRPRAARLLASSAVAVGLVAWSAVSVELWLSGRHYPAGRIGEETVAEAVARQLEPGTIVIGAFTNHYLVGKMTYLLMDDLARVRPTAWLALQAGEPPWERVAADPSAALDPDVRQRWPVRWAGLDRLAAADHDGADWRRVVYLVQEEPSSRRLVAEVLARCPGGVVGRWEIGSHPDVLRLVVCEAHPALE